MRVVNEVTQILRNQEILIFLGSENNLLKVKEPVVIIGDVHGQFYDMIHIFEKVIDPKGIDK